ncbi:hypothetical protein O181_015756 [Austropuccinia psidii MF-1]|uniref:Uncharacterized protein n=1 Tax=Austropuccinia psidii MF-1 TaxID=1389203 RepID=A0A9Q3C0G8_9BASI|nr:hypothetical protein [Austropuccinia psidii MF-1]
MWQALLISLNLLLYHTFVAGGRPPITSKATIVPETRFDLQPCQSSQHACQSHPAPHLQELTNSIRDIETIAYHPPSVFADGIVLQGGQRPSFTRLLHAVSENASPNPQWYHYPAIPATIYPQAGHFVHDASESFRQLPSSERDEPSTQRGLGSTPPLASQDEGMNDSLSDQTISEVGREKVDEERQTAENSSRTLGAEEHEIPLEPQSKNIELPLADVQRITLYSKLQPLSIKPSETELIWIASTPAAKLGAEVRKLHLRAFMSHLAPLEVWASLARNFEAKPSQPGLIMQRLVARLWNLNAKILIRFGFAQKTHRFNNEQGFMLSWYLNLVKERHTEFDWCSPFQLVNALSGLSSKKKWLVYSKNRSASKVSEQDLDETKIVVMILGSYYKSLSSEKWNVLFLYDRRFVLMLEQIRKRLGQYNPLSRSEQKNQLQRIFPWWQAATPDLFHLKKIARLPAKAPTSYLHLIKDLSQMDLERSNLQIAPTH